MSKYYRNIARYFVTVTTLPHINIPRSLEGIPKICLMTVHLAEASPTWTMCRKMRNNCKLTVLVINTGL